MPSPSHAAIFLLLVTGLAARPAPACADQVMLTYGDRISGHIVSVTRDTVRIETAASGIIEIDRMYLEQLSTDAPRVVDLVSGERVIGQIVADSGNAVTIRSSVLGDRRVSVDAIDAVHELERSGDSPVPLSRVQGRGTRSRAAPVQQPLDPAGTQQPGPIGQAPEDTEDIRRIFLRQSTVLLRPGQAEVEAGITYLHSQSVSPILSARYRQFQLPLAIRVGLFNRAEGFVSVPVTYAGQDLGFADRVVSHKEAGAGDLAVGINYEVARETARGPDVILSFGVGTPTGSEPNEEGLSLGTGHWGAAVGLQFIRTVDPVALFAGVRYEHQFAARYFLGDGVRHVDPGETAGYNFGFGFAVNENVSLSAQVLGSYQSEAKADDERVFASSREPVSFRSALTYQHSRGTYVEPSINIGLVEDTPDFAFGISLTHRFGQ
jgi:hypothetical protein